MKSVLRLFLVICVAGYLAALPGAATAFDPNAAYTVVAEKMNSDGSLTEVGSVNVTADADGKIEFSFSGVPTNPDVHFLIITVKDANGNVVRKSFVPAPPASGTCSLGVNNLSDVQTDMIVKVAELLGSDDPITIAFGLILTRAPGLTDADVGNIAALGKRVIQEGLTGSFQQFLLDNGVSSSKLTALKNALAYNAGGKDLSDFTSLFKSAVDNPAQAQDDMAKAGGLIADIFVDAAASVNIELALILAAHDSAGYLVDNDTEASQAFAALPSAYQSAIGQAMASFFMRIAYVRLATEYTNAMTTLNATGAQVSRFNGAVSTLSTALEALDKKYAQYYADPENNPITPTVQQQMNTDYNQVFTTFMADIMSTDTEIAEMKDNIASALGVSVSSLPSDVGTYYDFNGQPRNWPIPMAVVTNWVAGIISAGGGLTYTRDTLPIPGVVEWLGTCSDSQYWNKQDCEGNGGTWTTGRTDYASQGMPASFAALMGLREDVEIVQMTRYYIYDPNNPNTGGQPTRDQEKQAKVDFAGNLNNLLGNIGGTTDGTASITNAQKKSLLKLMLPPDPY